MRQEANPTRCCVEPAQMDLTRYGLHKNPILSVLQWTIFDVELDLLIVRGFYCTSQAGGTANEFCPLQNAMRQRTTRNEAAHLDAPQLLLDPRKTNEFCLTLPQARRTCCTRVVVDV